MEEVGWDVCREDLRRVSHSSLGDQVKVSLMIFSYTYELCFFGSATQKSNKDYSNNHLGSVHQELTLFGVGSS